MNNILRFLLLTILLFPAMQLCFAEGNNIFPEPFSSTPGELVLHSKDTQSLYGYRLNGEIVIPPGFEKAYPFSPNGLALVKIQGLYGYIKTDGKFVLNCLKDAKPFDRHGLAAIKKDKKWGIINTERYFILKDIFDKIEDFQPNGFAIVKYENKYGLVDTLGNVVLPVIYDKVENFDKSGYAYIKDGKMFGVVDKRGRAIVPAEYKDKKSAMAAVSDAKSKFGKTPDVTLAEKAEKVRQEEQQKQLAEQARKEDEQKRQAEARKRLEETPTLKNYIAANLGEWNDFLASKNLNIPSEDEIRNLIEEEVGKWQVKGEFEPTARWKERVNETTRTAKINAMADSILSINSKKVEDVRAEYRKMHEDLTDRYCARIADQFSSQNLVIKPYDADNETFLISTDDFGDFLLPVPLDEAPEFKQEWDTWKSAAIASFVPNGEDVVLKSVSIGKYKYDSDMDATYAQVDVEYNFKPVDMAQLNRNLDAGVDMAMNSNNPTNNTNRGFQTEKIKISAGNTPDIDINIPEGTASTIPTFAVVIANSEYAHASKVAHAENDGRIMSQYLTHTLGIPEGNVATFINATYGQMASAISMLQDIGDAYQGSDFNLIFYYVGHGLPDDEGKKSYILPVDIDPRMVSICMPLEKIYADLGTLGAKNVTVMVDACFSGTNHGEGMLVPQSMGVAMKPKSADPVGNMVVLTATDGNETAFPYEEKSHGLFTYWLLKKLQETSGEVTFGELSDYVIDNVKKTSVTVNKKPQTPTVATSPQLTDSWRDMKFGN